MPNDKTDQDRYDELAELAHFGVKGMRWGVRTNRKGYAKPGSFLKKSKYDPNDKPQGYSSVFYKKQRALTKVYATARPKIKRSVKEINRNPKYKGKDFRTDSKLRREYHADISKAITEQLNAAGALKGYNDKQTHRLQFKYEYENNMFPTVTIRAGERGSGKTMERKDAMVVRRTHNIKKLRHDAMSEDPETGEIIFEVKGILDSNGYVIDFEFPRELETVMENGDETIKQMEMAGEYLAHFGVKGMRWGVVRGKVNDARARRGRKLVEKAGGNYELALARVDRNALGASVLVQAGSFGLTKIVPMDPVMKVGVIAGSYVLSAGIMVKSMSDKGAINRALVQDQQYISNKLIKKHHLDDVAKKEAKRRYKTQLEKERAMRRALETQVKELQGRR